MNPQPCKGQRWMWDYDQRGIKSRCITEIVSCDSSYVKFKYVQIVYTNYSERIGSTFGIGPDYLNDTSDGIFTYLEGQDSPQ